MSTAPEISPYVWATVGDYDLQLWNRHLKEFRDADSGIRPGLKHR